MEKIPTIDEFLPKNSNGKYSRNEVEKAMIAFAKLHVESALKEASEKSKIDIGKKYSVKEITLHPTSLIDTAVIKVNVESILESYSLDNIK